MVKKQLWGITKQLLKVVVTSTLLYLVYRNVDVHEVKRIFLTSNPWLLLSAMLLYLFSQVVSSWRSLTFFKAKGLILTFPFNLKLYLLGMFYNLFLPGGIGGDGYKIYLLRKRFNFSGKKLLNAVFLDRLSGLWAIGIISGMLTVFLPQLGIPAYLVLGALVVGSVVYLMVLKWVFKMPPKYMVIAHMKALGVQSLQIFSVLAILSALHFQGKYSPYLFTFLASSLAAIFPFTVGGLGAREYVFLQASDLLHMDAHVAVFVSLVFYLQSALISLTGIYFVFRSKEFEPMPKEESELEVIETENAP